LPLLSEVNERKKEQSGEAHFRGKRDIVCLKNHWGDAIISAVTSYALDHHLLPSLLTSRKAGENALLAPSDANLDNSQLCYIQGTKFS
jgi:hypothetical protein